VFSIVTQLLQFTEKFNLDPDDPDILRKYTDYRLDEIYYNSQVEKAQAKGKEKMLRIFMQSKKFSETEIWEMAQQAGISKERYEQIRKEELTNTNKPRQKTKKKSESEI